ncbi:mucin-5B [Clupea harengus]|uniref:Mucin-5B n=1 Tax=Clupea harengus TaxID=7950 RepID=A0A8M1KAB2_CLUHA|nr:mucin-5B [Clupea harengus]
MKVVPVLVLLSLIGIFKDVQTQTTVTSSGPTQTSVSVSATTPVPSTQDLTSTSANLETNGTALTSTNGVFKQSSTQAATTMMENATSAPASQPNTTAATMIPTAGVFKQSSTQAATTMMENATSAPASQPNTTAATMIPTAGVFKQSSTQAATTMMENATSAPASQPNTTAATMTPTAAPQTTTAPQPAPVTAASIPEPEVKLEFKLEQSFTPQLQNTSSPAFQSLADKVSTALDKVYTEKFGSSFNRTEIKGFRQGSVIVESVLIFNDVSSVPETGNVTDTLVQAVSSNSSDFADLGVNPTSIKAERVFKQLPTQAPTTIMENATSAPASQPNTTAATMIPTAGVFKQSSTQAATTMMENATSAPASQPNTTAATMTPTAAPQTTAAPQPAPVTAASIPEPEVKLEFKLEQTFTPQLQNTSSTAFKSLATKLSSALDKVYSVQFGSRFNRTEIKGFRQGSVIVESVLIFNDVNSVPETENVTDTLVQAVSSNSSDFADLGINSTSIKAERVFRSLQTQAPTTMIKDTTPTPTSDPNTTTAATSLTPNSSAPQTTAAPQPAPVTAASIPEPEVKLEFKLEQTFTPQLQNTSSTAFKSLATKLSSALDKVYSVQFGSRFNRTEIKGFRQGSVIVDSLLIFNDVNSVPETENVTEILVQAVSTNSSDFAELGINSTSIKAERVFRSLQTQAPTTMIKDTTPTPTSDPNTTTAATSLTPNSSAPQTTLAPQPAPVTAASIPEPEVKLEFKLEQTFTPQLQNTSSTAFKSLATKLSSALDKVYSVQFGSRFNRTEIKGFRQGSVIVDSLLIFNDVNSVPETENVTEILVQAVSTNSSDFAELGINSTSIKAERVFRSLQTQAPTTMIKDTTPTPTSDPNTTTAATSLTPNSSAPQTTAAPQPAPVTAASIPEPEVKLEFKLEQTFTPQLQNTSSTAFKSLATKLSSALDKVYSVQFGSRFNRTEIKGFRQGSVIVDSLLIFNDVNSVPETENVTEILVQAVSTNSSDFAELRINSTSIKAERVFRSLQTQAPTTMIKDTTPTPTSDPNTTTAATSLTPNSSEPTSTQPSPVTAAPVPDQQIKLEFRLQQTFTPNLANPASTEFKSLATKVSTVLDRIYSDKFGSRFVRTQINGFRQGSVVVDSVLIFNDTNNVPDTANVTSTLEEAIATNGSDVAGLAINGSSIVAERVVSVTTQSPASPAQTSMASTLTVTEPTSTQPSPVTAAPVPDQQIKLEFRLQQTFTPNLANPASTEFKSLATKVSTVLNRIYSDKFGPRFVRTQINGFRQGSVVVDSVLIFNDTNNVPDTANVTSTLEEAIATNSSDVAELAINGSSIVAERVVSVTTQSPASPAQTSMASTLTVTEPTSTQPSPVTAAPVPDQQIKLEFRLQQTFTPNLANPASTEFKSLATKVSKVLDRIYSDKFGSRFVRTQINGFRQGSVVVDSVLIFNDTNNVPDTANVTSTLEEAIATNGSDVAGLAINGSSIVAERVVSVTTQSPASPAQTSMASTLTVTEPTSTQPSPVTAAPVPDQQIKLEFRLQQTFTPNLANPASTEFKSLATKVSTVLNRIYSDKFGPRFVRTQINGFRQGSVVVDSVLIFNDTNNVPDTANVTSTCC